MTTDSKKAFLQAPLRAREQLIAQSDKPALTETERLSDLERAVASLALAVPKGKTTHVAKVVANLVLLKSMAVKDIPAALKEEVEQVLKRVETEKNPRKEDKA